MLEITSTLDNVDWVVVCTALAIVAGTIVLLFRRIRIRAQKASVDHFAYLDWVGEGTYCFCRPTIRVDLSKLNPTAETIGALFGLRNVGCIRISTKDGITLVKDTSVSSWPMKAGRGYNVVYKGDDVSPCSIRDTFSFLGENEEQIHKLSLAFYNRIWADESNRDFRLHFTSSVKHPEEAADNQARWLIEMWGGPPRYTEKHDSGLVGRRMLSRHANPARMTFRHACTWLEYMNSAVAEVYGDNMEVKLVLGLYWRHFFGFFPFTDKERIGIREKALNDNG